MSPMAVDWKIEALSSQNAGLLESMQHDVFDNAVDPAQLQAFIDDPRHVLLMAIADSSVVGMASGVEYFHPDKQPQMWINEVGVADDYQNRGIGRSLINALIAEARTRGCDCAWLGTEPDNDPANACYRHVPGGSAPEPFVLYEWELD